MCQLTVLLSMFSVPTHHPEQPGHNKTLFSLLQLHFLTRVRKNLQEKNQGTTAKQACSSHACTCTSQFHYTFKHFHIHKAL